MNLIGCGVSGAEIGSDGGGGVGDGGLQFGITRVAGGDLALLFFVTGVHPIGGAGILWVVASSIKLI